MIKALSALIAFLTRILEGFERVSLKKFGVCLGVSRIGLVTIVSLICLGIAVGCAKQEASAAPISDKRVLERLAEAFEEVGQGLPVSPAIQPPKQKKSFVIDVFDRAGYSYRATLFAVAQSNLNDEISRGLIELLLFPTVGVGPEDVSSIYSVEELAAVRKLQLR